MGLGRGSDSGSRSGSTDWEELGVGLGRDLLCGRFTDRWGTPTEVV